MTRVLVPFLLLLGALAVVGGGCNRRVFFQAEPACNRSNDVKVSVPTEKAADILVVVDNSGSMQEEQTNLAANFVNDSPACPIGVGDLKDFARCDDASPPSVCQYANPTPEDLETTLKDCGFIQVLAAFGNDFRVGVITTDIGLCDNRYPPGQSVPAGEPDWGFRPQRGCLQPDDQGNKIISRADLGGGNDDIGNRFTDTLNNIRVFGSPIERGLDAAKLFLDPDADRAPGCDDDLKNFLRDDAKLVIIFLTDEQDCSRLAADEIFDCPSGEDCKDGMTEFTNEVCDEFLDHFTNYPPDNCYSKVGQLTDVSKYAGFFRGVKKNSDDVSVAVIAGGVFDGDNMIAGGCKIDGSGNPNGSCDETHGTSNSDECRQAGANCCVADNGSRYFELADELGGLKDSICFNSFRGTMIRIAAFIGAVDFVDLAEPPANPATVYVELTRAGSKTGENLGQAESGTTCDGRDGWVFETETRIRFCGSKRPGPGDTMQVFSDVGSGDPSLPPAERCRIEQQESDAGT